MKIAEVEAHASVEQSADGMGASNSPGSFRPVGRVVAPCPMRSMAEIGRTGNTLRFRLR